MDASEVAISLVIGNALLMLSEGKILSHGLRSQLNMAINHLQEIFVTSKLLEFSTDNDQQSSDRGSRLLDLARDAGDFADKILLEGSQHLMSNKGRLTKIRALVRFVSLRIRVRATEKMALKFLSRVEELSSFLFSMQDTPPCDPLYLDENALSRNAYQGNVHWNGKVESDIVGREDEERQLRDQLFMEDGTLRLRVVWVVGEESIGKTALVRSVYNRFEIDHSFHCRLWVHVPEEFTLKDFLVKILKQTSSQELKDLEHIAEKKLKEIFLKSLMKLRHLIVFDDLRKAEVMAELINLLAGSENGSRVIITTRFRRIPSIVEPNASLLELHELDEDQSERLLRERGTVVRDPGLKSRILSKCSGSPPRILLLGGLAVASDNSSPVMVDQLAHNPTLHDIMSLSYHRLPSLLKPCLLYLCLFPKDMEISTGRLFRLWHAEGLVPGLGFGAEKCFEELVGRNLVHVVRRGDLGGKSKSCRVPGFLLDFLSKIATQIGLLQPSAETEDHQPRPIQLQHLRCFVSFNTQKRGMRAWDVEELLRPFTANGDCGLLRVLDLEGVDRPLLPDGLGNILPNLRYLGLQWTALNTIPESVGNMSRLETLDLKHTDIRNLPSSIWKMKSLQHLYMNEVCFDKSTNLCKPSAKYQSNLQTLWGLYIGAAKSPMLDVLSKLTRLEKLGLTCSSLLVKKATECISKLPKLQYVKLRSRNFFDQPSDLKMSDMTGLKSLSYMYLLGGLPKQDASLKLLPRNLKILTLSMSGLRHDAMPVLGQLERLEILNLLGGSYTGQELICGSGSFPSLRVLKLWMLEGVKEARVDETALCCLEELEIKKCKDLASIASLDHIRSLKQIRVIKAKESSANIDLRVPQGVIIKTV